MATTAVKKTKTTETTTVSAAVTEPVAAEPVKTVEVKKEKKTYAPTDGIPCKSITNGGLYMPGLKSNILYTWIDAGDVIEIEYQDLQAAIRSNNSYVMNPFFVIEDEELVAQFPQLKKIYDALYSVGELEDVLTELSPGDMKATILSLPKGAQESIKHLASKMVSDGRLDSVRKIKVLDEIFDTEMSIMTGLFS
nr:MAG TPA: hypothetical protein [Caudoviricetes sp.]